MSTTLCHYAGNRDDMLVAYLYDEMGADRDAFESHLARCAICQNEIEGLRAIRSRLAEWTPPGLRSAVGRQPSRPWWQEMPAWAQVAAALLFLGVSAGIANLNIRYNSAGLSVKTGWSASAPTNAGASTSAPTVVGASVGQVGGAAPWQADMARLEDRLRGEMHAATGQTVAQVSRPSAPGVSDAELTRRMKMLVDDSERKGQRELALRVAEISRDMQAQREADLSKIERNLGVIQNNTGFEVMRQRELINSLAVRVSSQQPR
jgi:hypothetical protein